MKDNLGAILIAVLVLLAMSKKIIPVPPPIPTEPAVGVSYPIVEVF